MPVRNLDPIHAELLAEVPDVFGLGKLIEMQVKINVKSEAIPRFFKPHHPLRSEGEGRK